MLGSFVLMYVGAGSGGVPPVHVQITDPGAKTRAPVPALTNVQKPVAKFASCLMVPYVFAPIAERNPGAGARVSLFGSKSSTSPGSVDVSSDANPRTMTDCDD